MQRLFLATLIALAGTTAAAQDPASPNDYKVEIDNTWVRVLRVRQGPHATAPLNQHAPSVMVYLTDVDQRITGADGKAREVTHKAGEVAYIDAAKHADENLSDQPLETVAIELKSGAPKSPPITLDPVKLDPEHHPVPLENDRVRVLRTILVPHLKSPMHQHPHYVVVYLTELHTTMTLGDGRVVDNPRRPGEIAWRDALQHETENIGDHTAVEIQVEIK
jgi:quercetin dioxygenase-like cupin family protein